MHSNSVQHGGIAFSAQNGGSQFISVSAPVGRTVSHAGLIRPVGPTYVTEYKAAYTCPPASSFDIDESYNEYNETVFPTIEKCAGGSIFKQSSFCSVIVPESKWMQLRDVTDKLKLAGFEIELMESVLKTVLAAKLDYALENAHTKLMNAVLAAAKYEKENGSYPEEMNEETVKLCVEFAAAVTAIKSC